MSYKFNPFTEKLDLVTPNNYSYDYLNFNLIIPEYQQMIVYHILELNYNLEINGKLVILD